MDNNKQEYPEDLVSALSDNPLVYLIPKQDLIPYATPISVDFIPRDVFASSGDFDEFVNEMTQEQIKDLVDLFDGETEQGIKGLRFKKPASKLLQDSAFTSEVLKSLNPLEKMVFTATKDIEKSQLMKPDIKVKRVPNLRNDDISMTEVQNYLLEFAKESSVSAFQEDKKIKRKSDQFLAASESVIKRLKSEQGEINHSAPLDIIKPKEFNDINLTDTQIFVDKILQEFNERDFDTKKSWNWDNAFRQIEQDDIEVCPSLTFEAARKLEALFDKLSLSGKVSELPTSTLIEVQKIACQFMRRFNAIEWNHALITNFEVLLSLSLLGSTLLKTMFVILSSGLSVKEIYLEDHIKESFSFIFSLFEHIIYVAVDKNKDEIYDDYKIDINYLLSHVTSTFQLIGPFVETVQLDDTLLPKLEYFLTDLVYHHNYNDKFSFQKLPEIACKLICSIYKKYENQRQFLLTEILVNIERAPSGTKDTGIVIRLKGGQNIQLITYLIVSMLECEGLQDFKADDAFWDILDSNQSKMAKKLKSVYDLNINRFNESLDKSKKQFRESVDTVSLVIADKLVSCPDNTVRKIIAAIVNDLLAIVLLPEYPAAETLLDSLLNLFLFVCNTDKFTSFAAETFSLDMIGLIGSKIIQIRRGRTVTVMNADITLESFDNLFISYKKVLHCMEIQGRENSFLFLFSKFLLSLDPIIREIEERRKKGIEETMKEKSIMVSYTSLIKDYLRTLHGEPVLIVDDGHTQCGKEYMKVILSQTFSNQYDNLVLFIVKSLDNAKARSRSKAVKNLSLLISREPSLLSIPLIRANIKARLGEPFSSIRDSIIELLSENIKTNPTLIEEFYEMLCSHIDDESVAVRKRAINLSAMMYQLTDNINVKVTVCEYLLRRQNDEQDSIIKLAMGTLYNLWFQRLLSSKRSNQDLFTLETVNVMKELVFKTQRNWNIFERFVKEQILYKHDNNIKFHSLLIDSIEAIVKYIAKFVIEHFYDNQAKQEVEKTMAFLAVIIRCDGTMISQDDLIALQPYLSDDRALNNSVSYNTLLIFKYALLSTSNLRVQFINQCEGALIARLTKFNFDELSEAVHCLWLFANMKGNSVKLAAILGSTLQKLSPFLKPVKNGSVFSSQEVSQIKKLLHIVGAIGRFCNLEDQRQIICTKVELKGTDTIAQLSLKYMLVFCDENLEATIRRVAFRNLIDVCSNNPKAFLFKPCLYNIKLAFQSADIKLRIVIVERLLLFIKGEEEKSVKRNGLDKKISSVNRVDYKTFSGQSNSSVIDSVCNGIVATFIGNVLELCLMSESPEIVSIPISFLKLVVTAGMVIPENCVPTVIALESSGNKMIRMDAIAMHTALYERYESLIDSCYIDGIKKAISYRKSVSKDLFSETFFLQQMFTVVSGTRRSRVTFFKKIAKSFVIQKLPSELESAREFLDYVHYVTLCLTQVKFATFEEGYILASAVDELSTVADDLINEITSLDALGEVHSEDWQLLSVIVRSFEILQEYRNKICSVYHLSENTISDYARGDTSDPTLRELTKLVHDYSFDLSLNSELDVRCKFLDNFGLCRDICLHFTSSI